MHDTHFNNDTPFRIGFGTDSHRFLSEKTDKKLVLGGIVIENHVAVDSHSDGDVILHALFNALSSAIGEKSIGQFFPDNDPKWKGVDSRTFVKEILSRVSQNGYAVGNVVFSLEGKTPKVSPHEPAIKHNLSELLSIPPETIAVHATTGEGLTSFGRGEGLSCQAIVLLYKKSST